MGTYLEDAAARREAATNAARVLHTVYERWWEMLDGRERGNARTFLGGGIPDDVADRMEEAGIQSVWGIVSSADGVRRVRLPRASLSLFIATRPGGPRRN